MKQAEGIKRHSRSLALSALIALYLATGVAYMLVTPILEKSDEQGHYGYILYLREQRALPPLEVVDELSFEFKQPPLYYGIVWLASTPVPVAPFTLPAHNPYIDLASPYLRNDNRAVYLHPPTHTPIGIIGRSVSLVFGLGTLLVTYALACEVFGQHRTAALVSAMLVGFQPRFLYMATAVNNDAAAAFFGATLTLLLVWRYKRPPFHHFAPVTGAVLGLAILTKTSNLLFFPLIALALFLRPPQSLKHLLREGAILVLTALLVGGWWYLRNTLVFGDALTLQAHLGESYTAILQPGRLFHSLSGIEVTFWGNLARPTLRPLGLDHAVMWWGRVSTVLLIVGLARWRSGAVSGRLLLVLLCIPVLFLVVLVVFWNASQAFTFGRLLFPALAALMLLWVWGWRQAAHGIWQRWALQLSGGMMLCIGVLTPFVSIYPLYHPYRPFSADRVATSPAYLYLDERQEIIAELVGHRLSTERTTPGAYASVELCWRARGQTQTPYAVFVQVLDISEMANPNGPAIFGGRRTYPGLGNLPTDRWPLGKLFCDQVMVPLQDSIPAPVQTLIEVGLIDSRSGARLAVVDAGGNDVLPVLAGPDILPQEAVATQLLPAAYILDQAIGLTDVTAQVQGSTLTVTLVWQSHRSVSYDAVVFVHVRDANNEPVSQIDASPLRGRFATSAWIPGQVLTDTYTIALPAAYARPLSINLGMYLSQSMERLPVVDARNVAQVDNLITISLKE